MNAEAASHRQFWTVELTGKRPAGFGCPQTIRLSPFACPLTAHRGKLWGHEPSEQTQYQREVCPVPRPHNLGKGSLVSKQLEELLLCDVIQDHPPVECPGHQVRTNHGGVDALEDSNLRLFPAQGSVELGH